ncbi:MAG: hypothetical protein H7321_02745 [Bacteroidia bacterium]|nr:hypothetical protein [Bacteroidia bacterium]
MDLTVENKLKALWELQEIDSRLDRLNALKGELPIEVSDLEDELIGLQTRADNINKDIEQYENDIAGYKAKIKQTEQLVVKYKKQLEEVKNNREYEALNKEIEIAGLEIMGAEKRIKEHFGYIESKKEAQELAKQNLENRNKDLEFKKKELVTISKETEEEENGMMKERNDYEKKVEERLVKAYNRIRKNVKNGLAIASIERNSCGGCFSKIPPQRQSDIKQHLKIIDCEHCGRILVDNAITGIVPVVVSEEDKPKRRVRTLKAAKA